MPLEELYERFVKYVTPSIESRLYVHHLLVEYVSREDAVFIVRHDGATTRRSTLLNAQGVPLRPSDNSPAWWMHDIAFQGRDFLTNDLFATALANAPVHIHDASRTNAINRSRWYVAHLIPAKLGRVRAGGFVREEAVAAFLRNIHPFNHFYLPLNGARRYEADPVVLAFFAEVVSKSFGSAWEEFVSLAGEHASTWLCGLPQADPSMDYSFGESNSKKFATTTMQSGDSVVEYQKSRLWFVADVIEPLRMEERFRIVTPEGVFEMSKADFYRVFDNVVRSKSYQEGRNYHSKSIPRKAAPFRLS